MKLVKRVCWWKEMSTFQPLSKRELALICQMIIYIVIFLFDFCIKNRYSLSSAETLLEASMSWNWEFSSKSELALLICQETTICTKNKLPYLYFSVWLFLKNKIFPSFSLNQGHPTRKFKRNTSDVSFHFRRLCQGL